MSITINMHGSEYTATLRGERVSISVDGHWAGNGRWDGMIVDCAAHFGSDVQTDEVYEALDCAIQDAIDEAE